MLHLCIKPTQAAIMWWYYQEQTVNSLTAPSPNLHRLEHLAPQLPLPPSSIPILAFIAGLPSPTRHSCTPDGSVHQEISSIQLWSER